jgi:RimJ/RimL family protein N-acetyltransferase
MNVQRPAIHRGLISFQAERMGEVPTVEGMTRAEPLGTPYTSRHHRRSGDAPGATDRLRVTVGGVARAFRPLIPAAVSRPRLLRGPRIETPVDAHPIRTERLVLRRHRLEDADAWYRIQSSPEVVEHLPWPVRDRQASLEHLRHRMGHRRLWQSGDFLALAVERDGDLVGDVSLHLRDVEPAERSVEIGWVLDPAAGGQGFASEASAAMLDLAFTEVEAKTVTAVIEPGNTRSIALAERLGFLREDAPRRSSSITFVITPSLLAARRAERAAAGMPQGDDSAARRP